MRIASLIARYLLGLIFLVFGLNGFLHFLPGPIPPGVAGQFMTALIDSHYTVVIFLLQLIPGILLLANLYVPLALTLLAPVIANIFLFHLLMAPSGLPIAILVIILWFLVFYSVRSAFAGIFARRT
jgi:putative oxidoreductase